MTHVVFVTKERLAAYPEGSFEIITDESEIEQARAYYLEAGSEPEGMDPLVFAEWGEDVDKGRVICVRVPAV